MELNLLTSLERFAMFLYYISEHLISLLYLISIYISVKFDIFIHKVLAKFISHFWGILSEMILFQILMIMVVIIKN